MRPLRDHQEIARFGPSVLKLNGDSLRRDGVIDDLARKVEVLRPGAVKEDALELRSRNGVRALLDLTREEY